MFRVKHEAFLIEREVESWTMQPFRVNTFIEKGKVFVDIRGRSLGELELKQLLKIIEIKKMERIKV